jgi:ABC-type dipeptide/oligopeptide/nickel transport system permease subunit
MAITAINLARVSFNLLAFNLLGQGLQEVLDPKQRK